MTLPTVKSIIRVTAEVHGVEPSDLTGPSRLREITYPRFMAMALARKITKLSYPQIAAAFQRKDHTTIINGVRRADDLILTDALFAARFREIERRLGKLVFVSQRRPREYAFRSIRGRSERQVQS